MQLQSKREMFFKGEAQSPSAPPPQPPAALNNNSNTVRGAKCTTTFNPLLPSLVILHLILITFNSSLIIQLQNGNSNGIEKPPHITTNGTHSVQNSINKLIMKEKESHDMNHHDSNKLANERNEKEKIPSAAALVKPKVKELDGYVGFANLPNQVYRKAVKKGFEFTLMVVGESGLGKSTLINSMFLSDIYNAEQHPGPSFRAKKTVNVETTKALLRENGVNLTLTVVDTPGFGDAVDNSNCWVPIIDHIESKYEEFLTAESRVHRKAMSDNRVHCCLYFIAPSGHGLKQLDIEFMQRLHDKVNIIPVIAKSDTLTPEEIQHFKKQILNEIAQHKIKIYDFPEPNDEEEDSKQIKQLRSRVPYAVVGANTIIEVDGKRVRGRKYPWGIAEGDEKFMKISTDIFR